MSSRATTGFEELSQALVTCRLSESLGTGEERGDNPPTGIHSLLTICTGNISKLRHPQTLQIQH